jgi:hypothetical protein
MSDRQFTLAYVAMFVMVLLSREPRTGTWQYTVYSVAQLVIALGFGFGLASGIRRSITQRRSKRAHR